MSPRVAHSTGRLLVGALLLWAAGGAVYGTLRTVYGQRSAFVHVRWTSTVDDARRAELERRYSLTRGEREEGTTWGYDLTDVSKTNIQALVLDPLAEDTHQIHRTKYRIGYRTPRGGYAGADGHRTPVVLEILTVMLLLAGTAGVGLALLEIAGGRSLISHRLGGASGIVGVLGASMTGAASGSLHWLASRIPDVSPEAVALFRVLFGIGIIMITRQQAVSAEWVIADQASKDLSPLQEGAMQAFLAAPESADWLRLWITAAGVVFIAGLLTRTAFVLLAAGVLAWALLYTTRIGAHSIGALMIAIICLLPARWADAWSVDAWLRRWRGLQPAHGSSRGYGYTVWIPGLVLGVAFAAAAFAKVRGGPDWILNGTVKYHFLTDSPDALVDWGLWLGRYPAVAVLLSFAAVAIEALVIVGALSQRYRYRAAAGVAALSILAGFALFQGLLWPAWWLLLLSFLPWHVLRLRSAAEPLQPPGRLKPAYAAIVVSLLVQQIVVSARKLEVEPLFSTYDMYSTTYASPEQYEQQSDTKYWVVARFGDGTIAECHVSRDHAAGIADLPAQPAAWARVAPALETCLAEHRRAVSATARLRTVAVEARRVGIDWKEWRRAGEQKLLLAGPFEVGEAR